MVKLKKINSKRVSLPRSQEHGKYWFNLIFIRWFVPKIEKTYLIKYLSIQITIRKLYANTSDFSRVGSDGEEQAPGPPPWEAGWNGRLSGCDTAVGKRNDGGVMADHIEASLPGEANSPEERRGRKAQLPQPSPTAGERRLPGRE